MATPASSPTSLVIGYGNPDRQDDGLAWHVLCGLAERLGRSLPSLEEGFAPEGDQPHLLFVLQLTPELAELAAGYERVGFVDAHTGAVIPDEVLVTLLDAKYQSSPLTHHMTPGTCVALINSLYGAQPLAVLVSIKGDLFGFSHELSPGAQSRVKDAVETVYQFSMNTGIVTTDENK
jgi:hydrogenase maturation protease